MKDLVFIFFSIFTVVTGAGVILSRNVIYSAFNLVLSLFGLATLYLLWGATFISMIQVLIYAGAIVVLFVFVVMLLNFEKPTDKNPSLLMVGLSGASIWLVCLILLRILTQTFGLMPMPETTVSSVRTVSKLLFTQYLWPFEVLTVFLLAMIIGIFLVARPEKGGSS
jgi:NADH-quinone oxidoreductase subunit J